MQQYSQKTVSAEQLFNQLPQQYKHLVPNPQFTPPCFRPLTLKSIPSLTNRIKTQTLLELYHPPTLQPPLPRKPFTQLTILVFCQPLQELTIDENTSMSYPYVPVAYCSWLEGLGVKCVPLPYNMNEGSVEFLVERAHGLLIPGGGANLYKSYQKKQGYGPVMVGFFKIWRIIQKLYQKGIYFPIWGTCLGLQIILMTLTNDVKILSNLNSRAHQLQVYCDYYQSKILQDMPLQLKLQIQHNKLLNFQHAHGISVQKFLNTPKLQQKLKITGISKDKDGTWFCSILQGKQLPIYLSQFHPQKQQFSWTLKGDILHEKYSILLSQYFAQRFLTQCAKCQPLKKFMNQKQRLFYAIQQYKQIHTPQRHYKIYAIDYKWRYVDKEARKQLKGQRSVSTSATVKSIKGIEEKGRSTKGSVRNMLSNKEIQEGNTRRGVVLPMIVNKG